MLILFHSTLKYFTLKILFTEIIVLRIKNHLCLKIIIVSCTNLIDFVNSTYTECLKRTPTRLGSLQSFFNNFRHFDLEPIKSIRDRSLRTYDV